MGKKKEQNRLGRFLRPYALSQFSGFAHSYAIVVVLGFCVSRCVTVVEFSASLRFFAICGISALPTFDHSFGGF